MGWLKVFYRDMKYLLEYLSPVLVNPKSDAIQISLSRRFIPFQLLNRLKDAIEDDPYLNFLTEIKNYKVLGKVLNGTIKELYRDRNKLYFKNFFLNPDVYKLVKEDIKWVYEQNKDVKLTITKEGIVVYDNYHPKHFNMLLLTIHSGTYVPKKIAAKMAITQEQRFQEEDIDSQKLYAKLVLKQGGIWIDNKRSRFYCDFNRPKDMCIYRDNTPDAPGGKMWKEPPNDRQKGIIHDFYDSFYVLLQKTIDAYDFNIIFDGHTMRDRKGLPNFSMGTHYIPKFYLPIVISMKKTMLERGYKSVGINQPYEGGYILNWLNQQYPALFIFSMEINKKVYMNKSRTKSFPGKVETIGDHLVSICDISEEPGFRLPQDILKNSNSVEHDRSSETKS